jgi:Mrp family chromosome partitioning ATPase
MGAEEFVDKVLDELRPATKKGLDYLVSTATSEKESDGRLKDVSELANNPTAQNEFLLGSEPIWADIQANRAISRECDTTLWNQVSGALRREKTKGLVIITGTAGSGKSTSLMRLCLRLAADGVHVGWVDHHSDINPRQIRDAMRDEKAPAVLAIDDADMYGPELAVWIRELILTESAPLVVVATRSGKVDRVLSPLVLRDIPKDETAMPPLADADIGLLIELLEHEKRLGILTGRSRAEQEYAFREQAGRQLLVAMIQATSGKKFEEKAVQELLDLEQDGQRIYALLAVASSFRFGLTRDEILIASSDFTNAALNAVQHLVGRHIVAERDGGYVWARHRRIAEIITDELARTGQLGTPVIGLARLAAAKVSPTLRRADRAWRMLIAFINHAFLHRTIGCEVSRNLYGSLESVLSWDFHFWLQRGSLEVEEGDLNLAEHFLSTARSLSPDDVYLQTEWAYLQFRKACANPSAKDSPELVKEASETLESLTNRVGDPYPYHILGSQGLSWARRGIPNPQDKEAYLKRLIKRTEEGYRKYPKEQDLQQILSDLRREQLDIAVPKK